MTRLGYKSTEVGEIPENWGIKRIRQVAEVKYGKSNPNTEGNIPLIGSSGVFGTVRVPLIDKPTLVIGRKGTAGSVWDIRTPSWPSDTSFYLDYMTELVQKFLFEYMSFKRLSGENAKTTLPSLKREDVEDYQFPLPPLPEQQKIAEILTTADRKIELINKEIQATEKLKKGLMQTLLTRGIGHTKLKMTEIGEIPEKWESKKLGDIMNLREKKTDLVTTGIAVIPMELVPQHSMYCDYKIIDESTVRPPTYCEPGDLLIPKITPSVENGKQGIVPDIPHDFGFATSEVFAIACSKGVLNYFLFYLLKMDSLRGVLINSMIGSTGRQRVPKETLVNLKVPVPPFSEQRRIAEILSTVDKKLEWLHYKKGKSELLKKGLMQVLLTGHVRVNTCPAQGDN